MGSILPVLLSDMDLVKSAALGSMVATNWNKRNLLQSGNIEESQMQTQSVLHGKPHSPRFSALVYNFRSCSIVWHLKDFLFFAIKIALYFTCLLCHSNFHHVAMPVTCHVLTLFRTLWFQNQRKSFWWFSLRCGILITICPLSPLYIWKIIVITNPPNSLSLEPFMKIRPRERLIRRDSR